MAPGGLEPLDAAHVVVAGVEAVHRGQHLGGAGLRRQMHVVADGRVGVHGVHDAPGEIARVGGGVADAAYARDLGTRASSAAKSQPAGTDRDSCHVLASN